MIQTHHQLFGPVHAEGMLAVPQPTTYGFPGSAVTASTKLFRFDLRLNYASSVIWRVVWTPNNTVNKVRLVHADDGPTNITQIAEIVGDGSTSPRNNAVDVTSAFNSLVANKVYKNLGFQMLGDNTEGTKPYVFEVRLEIVWRPDYAI